LHLFFFIPHDSQVCLLVASLSSCIFLS
jgi:hypothetical protein